MKQTEDIIMQRYRELATAICAQAVTDYIYNPAERTAARNFIISERFTVLSGGADGRQVLRIIDRKLRDGEYGRKKGARRHRTCAD